MVVVLTVVNLLLGASPRSLSKEEVSGRWVSRFGEDTLVLKDDGDLVFIIKDAGERKGPHLYHGEWIKYQNGFIGEHRGAEKFIFCGTLVGGTLRVRITSPDHLWWKRKLLLQRFGPA